MKRLTRKKGNVYIYNTDKKNLTEDEVEELIVETHIAIVNKLEKIEDLEEELGIDLITFFKALKHGINGVPPQELLLDIENKCFLRQMSFGDYQVYPFKEYGKIWWLNDER